MALMGCVFACGQIAAAQVFNTPQSLQRGSLSLSGSPTVFMDDGANELALFVYGTYGLSNGIDFRVTAGFFETTNYIGGALEWAIRRTAPYISITTGLHRVEDPALDGALNISFPTQNGPEFYAGLDADLVLDDDPDLPAWAFLGVSYPFLDRVDMLLEMNLGLFEIAPHVLAVGFVFYL
jgi:hypothetical protein